MRRKYSDYLADFCTHSSINQIDGYRFEVAGPVIDFFSFFTNFSNILCSVALKVLAWVLGLKAYWYTGSAFFQILSIIFVQNPSVRCG